MRPVVEDTAVPRSDILVGLEIDFASAVVKGALGKVIEKSSVWKYITEVEKLVVFVVPSEAEVVSGVLFGGATHLVQTVEVDVRVSVEIVVVTFSISELPELTVFVMGHVVRVVYTLLSC